MKIEKKMQDFFISKKKNDASLFERIAKGCEGLTYMSETDAPITAFDGGKATGLNAGALADIVGIDSDVPVEEITLARFFDRLTTIQDWFGEREKENAKKFSELKNLLQEDLRDLKVFRFGSVQIDIIVAGTDQTGNVAGIRTFAVET
jgi:hypothetical protein